MRAPRQVWWGVIIIVALASMTLGCGTTHSSKATQPTKQDVQSDSDRFFDRLEKEQYDR